MIEQAAFQAVSLVFPPLFTVGYSATVGKLGRNSVSVPGLVVWKAPQRLTCTVMSVVIIGMVEKELTAGPTDILINTAHAGIPGVYGFIPQITVIARPPAIPVEGRGLIAQLSIVDSSHRDTGRYPAQVWLAGQRGLGCQCKRLCQIVPNVPHERHFRRLAAAQLQRVNAVIRGAGVTVAQRPDFLGYGIALKFAVLYPSRYRMRRKVDRRVNEQHHQEDGHIKLNFAQSER